MADITPTALPAEYQAQYDEAERRRKLAEELLRRYGKPAEGKQVGRFYIPPSPLTQIADAFGEHRAQKNVIAAGQERAKVLGRYDTDSRAAAKTLLESLQPKYGAAEEGPTMELPETGKVLNEGLTSPYKMVQELAKALQTQNNTMLRVAGPKSTPDSVVSAATRGDPRALVPEPQETFTTGVEISPVPGPGGAQRPLLTQVSNKTGRKEVLDRPSSGPLVSISNEKDAVGFALKQLEKTSELARNSRKVLGTVQEAIGALDAGAQSGITQPAQQVVRKILTDFGVPLQGTEANDILAAKLKDLVVQAAGGLGRQISDADRKFLEEASGSMMTDTNALRRFLSIAAANAMTTISDHNSYAQDVAQQYPETGIAARGATVPFRFSPGTTDPLVEALLQGKPTSRVQGIPGARNLLPNLGREPDKDPGAGGLTREQQMRLDELRARMRWMREGNQ